MHGNGGEVCDSFFIDDLLGCSEVVRGLEDAGREGKRRERAGGWL